MQILHYVCGFSSSFFFLLIFLKAKAQWDISYFNLHMNIQNSLSAYSNSGVLVVPVSI